LIKSILLLGRNYIVGRGHHLAQILDHLGVVADPAKRNDYSHFPISPFSGLVCFYNMKEGFQTRLLAILASPFAPPDQPTTLCLAFNRLSWLGTSGRKKIDLPKRFLYSSSADF